MEIPWLRYGIALAVLLFGICCKKIFNGVVRKNLERLVSKTGFVYDDILLHASIQPVSALIIVATLAATLLVCNFSWLPEKSVGVYFLVATSVVALWALVCLADIPVAMMGKKLKEIDALQFLPLLRRALKIFILLVGGILIIQNIGVDVGSLLAGLGIGGLAVALAAQDSLANFFGALVLLVDRPFKIGDWVTVNGVDGDVEEMGFRSTRIRTWHKSLVTLPNKALSSATIENWAKMNKRRVKQTLHLTYDTPPQKITQFVAGVEKILRDNKDVDQDFILVKFTDFRDSSLEILIYYFTITTAWLEFLAIRERNNCSFLVLAKELGINFAFPTRTVHLPDGNGVIKCV